MGFTSAFFGGLCGTAVHSLSNSIRKVPLSRQSYLYVAFFGIGSYVGANVHKWEKELVEDINEIRADKGMPPMVGSRNWIRYAPAEK